MSASPRPLAAEAAGAFRPALGLLAAVLVVAAAVAGWWCGVSAPEVAALDRAVAAVEDAHAGLLAEESGLRAYAATGDDRFLAAYRAALPRVAAADDALATVRPTARVAADVRAFRLAQQGWQEQWAAVAREPSARVVLAGSSRRLAGFFADGAAAFGSYRAVEVRLLADLRAEADRARARQGDVLREAAGLLAVLVGAAAGLLLHRRRRLVRGVVRPVRELAAAVAAGRLDAPSAATGPAELAQLRRDLAAMTVDLGRRATEAATARRAADVMAERLQLLLSFAREAAAGRSLRHVLEATSDAACALGGCRRTRVWLLDGEAGPLRLGYDTAAGRTGAVPDVTRELGGGPVGRAARYAEASATGPLEGAPAVALPLLVGGRVAGVLELLPDVPGPVDEDVLAALEALCGHVAAAVVAARPSGQDTRLAAGARLQTAS